MADWGQTQDWMVQGLCRQVDPDLWFPQRSGSSVPAKRICNGWGGAAPCPVRDQCLDWAITMQEEFGVWGGVSELERRKRGWLRKPSSRR